MKRSLSRGQGAGANAMRQLWEKSGMRTNGRKLLHTDSSGSNSSSHNEEADELTPSQRRRRRKITDRDTGTMLPGRRFPGKSRLKTGGGGVGHEEGNPVGGSTSTSSVASSVAGWSPDEYQIPFRCDILTYHIIFPSLFDMISV